MLIFGLVCLSPNSTQNCITGLAETGAYVMTTTHMSEKRIFVFGRAHWRRKWGTGALALLDFDI